MENDHRVDWPEVKILKIEYEGTSIKSPKRSVETMVYHSLLFTELCLIPRVKFFLV